MLDQLGNFHSKQEVMKISEVMYTSYDQGSDKQKKLLIEYLSKNRQCFDNYVIKELKNEKNTCSS